MTNYCTQTTCDDDTITHHHPETNCSENIIKRNKCDLSRFLQ